MATGGASLGTAEGRITVDAGQAISEIGRVGSMMDSLDAKAMGAAGGVSDFHQSTIGLAQGMQHLGRVGVGLGAATAAPFVLGVKAAADFEQSMANVNAVMSLQGDQYEELSDLALQLGKDTTFTGEEAASGIETLGKAGISYQDIVGGAAEATTNLAAAAGSDIPRAAEVMSAAMNAFNIEGKDAVVVADALAGVANQTQSDVNQLGIGLGQVAGVANAANMEMDETVAFLGLMADNGIRGSDAATSMKNAIISLLSPTDKASGIMDTLGISLLDADHNFIGLAGASQQFFDAWKRSGQTMSEFMDPLSDIVGRDAVRTLLFGMQAIEDDLNGGTKGWKDYLAAANDSGAAMEFAAKRMDSTEGAIERLRGSLNALQVGMGAGINEAIRQPIEGLVGLVNVFASLPAPILNAVSVVGLLAGGLTALGGAFLLVGGYVLEAVARFTAAGFALSSIVGPALAVAAAIAAIGIAIAAYQSNFLGFADGVDAVTDKLKEFLGINQTATDDLSHHTDVPKQSGRAWNGLEEALLGVGTTLSHSTIPAIRDAGRYINSNLVEGMFQARKVWNDMNAKGVSPLVAGLRSAAKFFDILGGVEASPIADLLGDVANKAQLFGDVFANFRADPALSAMTDLTQNLYGLGAAFNSIGLTTIGHGLIELASNVETASRAYQNAIAEGLNPFSAALRAAAVVADRMDWDGLAVQLNNLSLEGQRLGKTFEDVRGVMLHAGFPEAAADIGAFGQALKAVTGIDITGFTNKAAGAINAFDDAMRQATGRGLDPFHAGLIAVDAALDTLLSPEQQQALDNISQGIQNFGEAIGNIAGPALDRVSQFFNEIGTAVSTGNFQGVLDALTSLGSDIQTKLQEITANLSTIDIPSIVVRIAHWVIEQGEDLLTRIKDALGFGTGNAQAGLGGTGVGTVLDIPTLTARISGWVIEQATNLFDEIKTFLGFGGGTAQAGLGGTGAGGTVIDIPSITANISSWVVTASQSLGDAIQQFFGFGAVDSTGGPGERGEAGTASGGITLQGVLVNIASWAMGTLASMGNVLGEIKNFIVEQLNNANITIPNFTGWGFTLGPPAGAGTPQAGLGGTGVDTINLEELIRSELTAANTTVEGFTGWDLQLGTPEISWANIGEVVNAIDKPLEQIAISPEFLQMAKNAGTEIGTTIGTELSKAIPEAVNSIMGGGGAGGPTDIGSAMKSMGANRAAALDLGDALGGFAESFVAAFKASAGPALAEAKAELIPWFQEEVRKTLADIVSQPIPSLGGVDMGQFPDIIGESSDLGANLKEALFGRGTDSGPSPADLADIKKTSINGVDALLDARTGAVVDEMGRRVDADGLVLQYEGEAYAVAATRRILDGMTGRTGHNVLLGGSVRAGEADAAALRIVSPIVDGLPEAMGQVLGDTFELVNQETGRVMQVGFDAWGQVVETTPVAGLHGSALQMMSSADQALATGTLAAPMTETPTAVGGRFGEAVQAGIDQAGEQGGGLMVGVASEHVAQTLDNNLGASLKAAPMPATEQAVGGLLGAATQAGVEGMGAEGTSAATGAAGQAAGSLGAALDSVMSTQIQGTTLTGFSQAIGQKIGEAITAGMTSTGGGAGQGAIGTAAGGGGGIGLTIASSLASAIQGADFTGVGTVIQTKISAAITAGMSAEGAAAGGGVQGGGAGIGASIASSMALAITGADFAAVGTAIQLKISQAVTAGMAAGTGGGGGQGALGTAAVGGGGIGSAIASQIASQISGADFSAVGTAIAQQIGASLGQGTGDLQAALGAVIQAMVASAQQATAGAQAIGTMLVQNIGAGVGPAAGTLVAAVNAAVTVAIQGAQASAATAQTIGTAIVTAAGQGVGAGTGTVTAAVGSMVSAAISAGTAAAAGATAIGAAITSNTGAGVGQGAGTVTAAVGAVVQAAIDAGMGAAAGASAIGVAIGQGIADGISSMTGVVEAAARAVVGAAVGAANAAADTGSPSKLFRDEVGVPMSQGVAVGILAGIPEVESAGGKLVESALKSSQNAGKSFKSLRDLTDQLGSVPGADELASRIAAVGDRLRESRKDIMGRMKDLTGGLTKTLHDGATKAGREASNIGKSVSSGLSAADDAGSSAGGARDSKKSIVGDLKGMKSDVKELQTLIGVLDRTPGAEGLAARMSTLAGNIDTSRKSALDSARDIVVKVDRAVRDAGKTLAQSGTDLGTSIGDGVSSGITQGTEEATSTAQSLIDQITGQLNANLDRLPEMSEAMGSSIGDGVTNGIDSTLPAVEESASGVGQSVSDGLASATPQMESSATQAVDSVTSSLDTAATQQSDFARQVGEAISQMFGQGVATGGNPQIGVDMIKSFHDSISQAVNGLLPQTQNMGSSIGQAFDQGIASSGNPASQGKSLVDQAGTGISQGLPAVNSAAKDAGSSIGTAMNSGITDSCNAVNNSAANLTDSCVPQGIESGTSTAEGIARGAGQDISEKLVDGLDVKKKDVTKQFGSAGSGFGKGMASGIGSTISDNVQSATEIAHRAGSVDGRSPGSSVGESFGQGMAAGIEKYIPAIIDAAVKAVRQAEDAAKKEGKSKSPSRVFMDIGRDLSLGMALGLGQGYTDIESVSRSIVRQTADVFGGAGLAGATRSFDRNMDRYTQSIERTLRWIDRSVDVKNLPTDSTLSRRESMRRANVPSLTDRSEGRPSIVINGITIPDNSRAAGAAYDLVAALESMHGQYIGKG